MTLERRYERLLRLYPARHRAVYGEEMLAVMLAGARPGQTRPGLRESADIVRAAAVARLVPGRGPAQVAIPDGEWWREAAAAAGVLLPMFLVALRLHYLISDAAWLVRTGWPLEEMPVTVPPPPLIWGLLAGWSAVLTLALLNRRGPAALVAWGLVAVEVTVLGQRYSNAPVPVLQAMAGFGLTVVAAAALSVPYGRVVTPGRGHTRGRGGLAVIGRGPMVWFLASVGLWLGFVAADPFLGWFTDGQVVHWGINFGAVPGFAGVHLDYVAGDRNSSATTLAQTVGLISVLGYLVAAIAAMVGVARLAPPVRRRLGALVAPSAVLVVVIGTTFGSYAESSRRFPVPVHLEPEQWGVLTVLPVLALLLARAWVRRADRREWLIRRGEAALLEGEPARPEVPD